MKKNVLREYLNNRKKGVTTIEGEEPTVEMVDLSMKIVKKAIKKKAKKGEE